MANGRGSTRSEWTSLHYLGIVAGVSVIIPVIPIFPIPVAVLIGLSIATLLFPSPPPDLQSEGPEKVGEIGKVATKTAVTRAQPISQEGLAWQAVVFDPRNPPPGITGLFRYTQTWVSDGIEALKRVRGRDGEPYQPTTPGEVSGLSRLGILAASAGVSLIDMWYMSILGVGTIAGAAIRAVAALVFGYAVLSQIADWNRNRVKHVATHARPSLGWLAESEGDGNPVITPLCVEWTHRSGPSANGALRLAGVQTLLVGLAVAGFMSAPIGSIILAAGAAISWFGYKPSDGGPNASLMAADGYEDDGAHDWDDDYLDIDMGDGDFDDGPRALGPSPEDGEDGPAEDTGPSLRGKALALSVREGTLGVPDELMVSVGAGAAAGTAVGTLIWLVPFLPTTAAIGSFLLVGTIAWRYAWGAQHPSYTKWANAVSREQQIASYWASGFPQAAPPVQATPITKICDNPETFQTVLQCSGSTALSLDRLLGPTIPGVIAPAEGIETLAISLLPARSAEGSVDMTRGSAFVVKMTWSLDPMSQAWKNPDKGLASQARLLALDHLFQTSGGSLPERPLLIQAPLPQQSARQMFSVEFQSDFPVPAWRKKLGEFRAVLGVGWAGFESPSPGKIRAWWSDEHPSAYLDPDNTQQLTPLDVCRRIDFGNALANEKLYNDEQETPRYVEGWRDAESGVVTAVFDLNGTSREKVSSGLDSIATAMGMNFARIGPPPVDDDGNMLMSRILIQTGKVDPLRDTYLYSDWGDRVFAKLKDARDKKPVHQPSMLWMPGVDTDRVLMEGRLASPIPHAILSGATGSGKTILLKSLFLQMAWANGPDVLKFFLMDGGVEAAQFSGLPHTVALMTQGTSKMAAARRPIVLDGQPMMDVVQAEHGRRIQAIGSHPSNPSNVTIARDVAATETVMAEAGQVPDYWDTNSRGPFPYWDTTQRHPLAFPTWIVLVEELPTFLEAPKSDKESMAIAAGFMDGIAALSTITRKTQLLFVLTAQRPTADVVSRQFRNNASLTSMYVTDATAARYVGDEGLSIADNPDLTPGTGVAVGANGVPTWIKALYAPDDELEGLIEQITDKWGGDTGRTPEWWADHDYIDPALRAAHASGGNSVAAHSDDLVLPDGWN
jgi:hypothetical protein